MKQKYRDINLRADSLDLISKINVIIENYIAQGYRLSVRQIYYRLVAAAVIPNTEKSYKRVVGLATDGRIAGLIDWEAIQDRNRDVLVRTRWENGQEILKSSAAGFHMDQWVNQPYRVFFVVEKAALEGVFEPVCSKFDVPMLAARGYPSVSVMREMVLDHMVGPGVDGQRIIILHCGDHDPSGIDMTRDLSDRMSMFAEGAGLDWINIHRIALTMQQIEEQKPPPNPAKSTDSRFNGYKRNFGESSWELDALEPAYMANLATQHIKVLIDNEAWDARKAQIEATRAKLQEVADNFKEAA